MRMAYLKQLFNITILTLSFGLVPAYIAQSHEVLPSIADITLDRKSINVEMRLTSEALLAEIDLQTASDTSGAENEQEYDRLRLLEPEQLEIIFRQYWPELAKKIHLRNAAADSDFELTLMEIRIDPVGDIELPRFSYASFSASRPDLDPITFSWDKTLGAVILRQQGIENGITEYLASGQESPPIDDDSQPPKSGWLVFVEYIPVGFDHILPKGLDHVLFVLGLYFLSLKLSVLLWQITSFTLAHTVTLAAAALGLVSVPATLVEPLIAASIVFVAVENLFSKRLSKWRPFVIFAFGLLHGLGFASVLSAFGLPETQFIPALIGFNIGVELGQLTVILIAFIILGYWFGKKAWFRSRISIPASLLIAATGAWWFLERTLLA